MVAVDGLPVFPGTDAEATAEFAAQVMALDLRSRLGGIKVPVGEVSPFYAPDLAAMFERRND